MDVLIIGAGGHAWVVIDIFRRSNDLGNDKKLVGLLDDDNSLHGTHILGLEVLGGISSLDAFKHDAVIVAIGDNAMRARVFEDLKKKGERLVKAIHPTAVISPDVVIGEGTMVCGGVIVNPGSTVGNNVILNTGCTIDHHNYVGNHVHIAPGVHTGGEVRIEEGAFIGIGSTVMPRCRIGCWTTVGAGSVVTKDLPDGAVAFGVPAKVVRSRKDK